MKNRPQTELSKLILLSKDDSSPLFCPDQENLLKIRGFQNGSNIEDRSVTEQENQTWDRSLDGVSTLRLSKPKTEQDEKKAVQRFITGLRKLFSPKNNWTFYQQLMLSVENCVHCHTCDDACPVYISSGKSEIYRPSFRLEALQELKSHYVDRKRFDLAGYIPPKLNWNLIARLAELSYRCTLCRRCAQACPMGVDNGLVARELRKLFSQEFGFAPQELHEMGTVRQLSSDTPASVIDTALLKETIFEMTGKIINPPIDKAGADILVICSADDYPARMKCAAASAIIMDAAGFNWTFSSEIDRQTNNFGVWYDDIQFFRIARRQNLIARNLKVKRMVVNEWCGHSYKALLVISERIIPREEYIPRETYLPILEDLICNERMKIYPRKIAFPVTLHDPCNLVRQMGIIRPQRNIIKKICLDFREMEPHGVDSYCCGGGSGLGLMRSPDILGWRTAIAGRMKVNQILEAFKDVLFEPVNKYVCAPCLTCQIQINDLLDRYGLREKYHIHCGGLQDLVLNAVTNVKNPPALFKSDKQEH